MGTSKDKKIRVFKLAKDLGISSKELLSFLKEEGITVKSHMSALSPREAKWAKKKISEELIKTKKEKVPEKIKKPEEVKVVKGKKKEKQKKAKKTVQQVIAHIEGRGKKKKYKKTKKEEKKQEINVIRIGEGISVSKLGNLIKTTPNEIISACLNLGMRVTINQRLDFDAASIIADEFGYTAELSEGYDIPIVKGKCYDVQPRTPIVTVMGHVDHGKTTLLDYIRNTRVASQESGGITQKIGAYHIKYNEKSITFIDTPGHEAFTAMRARGANITDIVVLVVAANEGIKPQTVEAIAHAQAAGASVIVAINKMDLPASNAERVRNELVERGIIVHEYGGEVLAVEISALKGTGIDELLDIILLQAEDLELTAPSKGPGMGFILEAKIKKGLGNAATVVVKEGEIKENDSFVAGSTYGIVRLILDENDKRLKRALPSSAILIARFNELPEVGDTLRVVDDQKTARILSYTRKTAERERELGQKKTVSLESLYEKIEEEGTESLKVVIKGDDAGSIEALSDSLEQLSTDEVKIEVIHAGVGPITENDIMLASASNALVIGYKVHPNSGARKEAKNHDVEIRIYDVIFEIIEEIKLAMVGLLKPEKEEEKTAEIEVRKIFTGSRIGIIAGCYVKSGEVHNKDIAVLLRNNEEIIKTKMESLKRFEKDVKSVSEGFECGIKLKDFEDIEEGDIIETYKIVEREKTL
ncbi:translation initiation factor IF-2 [candidate division WOR-3 bacterium]|nr:translation initiation factor IF-2 [candidate division WOR-3 bacterium]